MSEPATKRSQTCPVSQEVYKRLFEQEWYRCVELADAILGDGDLAEDIAQEAFARVWDRRQEIREPSHATAFVRRTVRNLALNADRDLRRRTAKCPIIPHGTPPATPIDILQARELEAIVLSHMVKALPPQHRRIAAILALAAAWWGCSHNDSGAQSGLAHDPEAMSPAGILGDSTTFGMPTHMNVLGQHVAVVDPTDSLQLTLLDRRTGATVNRLARVGDGPNEMRGPWFVLVETDTPPRLWTFDIVNARFTLWDLRRSIPEAALRSVPFRGGLSPMSRPILYPGGILTADLAGPGTLAFADSLGRPTGEYLGEPPFQVQDFPPERPYAHHTANEFLPVVHPDGLRLALLFKHVDRIDIVDIETRQATTVQVGVQRLPRVTEGSPVAWDFLPDEYVNGQDATRRHIYSMYCGCGLPGQVSERATTLRVFDWSGNLTHEMRLDRYVTAIAVSPNDSVLYAAMDEPVPMIGTWILPRELRDSREQLYENE